MTNNTSRRNFLKTTAVSAAAAISIPQIVSASASSYGSKKIQLKDNDVILFQGDSITDWGRDRNKTTPNDNKFNKFLVTLDELMKNYWKNTPQKTFRSTIKAWVVTRCISWPTDGIRILLP